VPNSTTFAAVDLGSNSYHLIVAREEDGHLKFLDRLRETVRMAAGLNERRQLKPEAEAKALDCLAQFGQRLKEIPTGNLRAVGTNTLRRMRGAEAFLRQAERALGHPIDIISGLEEARLIYLGVARAQAPARGNQLVVDIGGGSTEVIIGNGFEARRMESLYMGCVSYSDKYFPQGATGKDAFKRAETAARLELRPIAREYQERGWEIAYGASGTIKAIGRILQEMGWCDGTITREGLKQLRSALIDAGNVNDAKLVGLADDRRPVFAGGFAVLYSVFRALKIEAMLVSSGALREGLLYDLLGRTRHEDVRENTVDKLCQRYEVDLVHARRVEGTALRLYGDVKLPWEIDSFDDADMLRWAARLHEIGLAVAHAQHHRHAAYLLNYSDMPGFSQHEQSLLATLVRTHRRKLSPALFETLPENLRERAMRLAILLRLAVLLHRSRNQAPVPHVRLTVDANRMGLSFPEAYLEEHALTRADLEQEQHYLKAIDYELSIA
jgi:exopolyphosphatase/guanosine-5'-triphosphate,3'-diphosphate pyrophosphatase